MLVSADIFGIFKSLQSVNTTLCLLRKLFLFAKKPNLIGDIYAFCVYPTENSCRESFQTPSMDLKCKPISAICI